MRRLELLLPEVAHGVVLQRALQVRLRLRVFRVEILHSTAQHGTAHEHLDLATPHPGREHAYPASAIRKYSSIPGHGHTDAYLAITHVYSRTRLAPELTDQLARHSGHREAVHSGIH